MSSGLGSFIAQRLAAALLTLAGAILFLFVIIQFVPGRPGQHPARSARHAGTARGTSPSAWASTVRSWSRSWLFFAAAVHGRSRHGCRSPTGRSCDMILEVLPNTLQLAGCALVLGDGLRHRARLHRGAEAGLAARYRARRRLGHLHHDAGLRRRDLPAADLFPAAALAAGHRRRRSRRPARSARAPGAARDRACRSAGSAISRA